MCLLCWMHHLFRRKKENKIKNNLNQCLPVWGKKKEKSMNPEDKKTSVSHSEARGRAHNLKHYPLPQLLMPKVHHCQPFTMFHSVTELAFSAHCSVQERETRRMRQTDRQTERNRQRETETDRDRERHWQTDWVSTSALNNKLGTF